jgi:hypothetical protein
MMPTSWLACLALLAALSISLALSFDETIKSGKKSRVQGDQGESVVHYNNGAEVVRAIERSIEGSCSLILI